MLEYEMHKDAFILNNLAIVTREEVLYWSCSLQKRKETKSLKEIIFQSPTIPHRAIGICCMVMLLCILHHSPRIRVSVYSYSHRRNSVGDQLTDRR